MAWLRVLLGAFGCVAGRLVALPEGLTLHALRRTYASILIALGRDPAYVMAAMGYRDPKMTLGLYAGLMSLSDADRERGSESPRKPLDSA